MPVLCRPTLKPIHWTSRTILTQRYLSNNLLSPHILTVYPRHHSQRPLSTQHHQQPELHPADHKPVQSQPNQNPSFQSASFKDLGATRTVKIVVLVCLGVLGTLETIFWTKAVWRYFVESKASGESTHPAEFSPSAEPQKKQRVHGR